VQYLSRPFGYVRGELAQPTAPYACDLAHGEVEFETSDGDIRRLAAGSVVLAEDTSGKGHISRHPDEGQLVVHIDLVRDIMTLHPSASVAKPDLAGAIIVGDVNGAAHP
jgi:hypothetical protein